MIVSQRTRHACKSLDPSSEDSSVEKNERGNRFRANTLDQT